VNALKGRASWLVLAALAAAFLTIGTWRDTGPRDNSERVSALARQLKCPRCNGESVEQSQAEVSVQIREEIARLVAQGRTDADIRASIERSYPGSQLVPAASGAGVVLWVAPVVALVLGLGGVALAFRRWRLQSAALAGPDDEDRALVDAALRAEADTEAGAGAP
jgi:cytochrome c-type biogenesis protein CcmH